MKKVIIVLMLVCALASGKDKLTGKFIQDQQEDKPMGYFTIHEHTVDVMSYDATIQMTLPRVGPEHPKEDVEVMLHRIWPVNNPSFTMEFWEWMTRVQRVSDAGVVPPKRKGRAE